MGIRVASFQWVMQCLMQRERLELDSHITFTVRARSVGEVVWLKRNKKSHFEPATITTSGSTQYKVHFLSDGAAMNGVTEQQVLHCDESLHRGRSTSGTSGTSGGISQEWIKKGAFVNILETANVEPGLGKIWKVHYVSSSSDVVKFVDIKRIKHTPMLKTIHSTG